nr:hypothetical protein [Propionicimonas sp.]
MRTPRPWILPTAPTSGTDLRASGISVSMLRTQVACGTLLRLRPDVYLAAAQWPEGAREQQIVLARAEQVLHPAAVISHASAASLWGFPHPGFGDWPSEGVHLTRVSGARRSREGVTHHLGALPASQVVRDAGGAGSRRRPGPRSTSPTGRNYPRRWCCSTGPHGWRARDSSRRPGAGTTEIPSTSPPLGTCSPTPPGPSAADDWSR